MRVADIMSKRLVVLMPGHSVRHAAQIMLEHGVSGVPVVDADKIVARSRPITPAGICCTMKCGTTWSGSAGAALGASW